MSCAQRQLCQLKCLPTFKHVKDMHFQVREEAQGASEGWPGGTPPVALQLTQGGEPAVLQAFQQYLRCRIESGSAATSSGRCKYALL